MDGATAGDSALGTGPQATDAARSANARDRTCVGRIALAAQAHTRRGRAVAARDGREREGGTTVALKFLIDRGGHPRTYSLYPHPTSTDLLKSQPAQGRILTHIYHERGAKYEYILLLQLYRLIRLPAARQDLVAAWHRRDKG